MLKVVLFAALALVLCPAIGSAELVNNVIDNFSSAGPDLGNGMNRTESVGASFVTGAGIGFDFLAGPSSASFTYSATSMGTLGSVDADFATGVSFATSFSFAAPGTFTIRAFGGDGVNPDNQVGLAQFLAPGSSGPVTFNSDFSGYKTLRFSVESNSAGFAAVGGTLTAVPEPTSFALFGVVVAGIGYRRRRP